MLYKIIKNIRPFLFQVRWDSGRANDFENYFDDTSTVHTGDNPLENQPLDII